ncbi:uncharacterized protein LOC134541152 [Bacillus rossius redtenbacheri]|uniref:uncharacterized protein LOC134541152 n=1 Tax=Bacillus rossius redtenbacheri TaxID=93214 RepID=UPI002FDDFDA3
MEKYAPMKEFVTVFQEYSKTKSEKTLNGPLLKCLQVLSVTSDLTIFDPGSGVSTEFFISLHQLVSSLDAQSGALWCAVSLLQRACQSPAARAELVHTFRFAPVLSRLLGAQLICDKKLSVLNLLQELTYGVRISWQEAHLRDLIPALVQLVDGSEKEVVGLALGVLVNLCYKNLPAVYTLLRCVDIRQFLRVVLKVRSGHRNVQVQVCKLLIVLDSITGEIPDILNFVTVTFSTLYDAFKANNVFLMRHTVDFFKDVQSNKHYHQMLYKYENYVADTERLLGLADQASSDECAEALFEFLDCLVSLRLPGMEALHRPLVASALGRPWSCAGALQLVCSVAAETRRRSLARGSQCPGDLRLCEDVGRQLEGGLDRLLTFFHTSGDQDLLGDAAAQTRLVALVQLLQEMCRSQALRQRIMASVNVQTLRKVFAPLLGADSAAEDCRSPDLVALYVHALDFVSGLAAHDSGWMSCYSDLLGRRSVQAVLATALYSGPLDVRMKVLALTSTVGFSAERLSLLARSLSDLDPLVLIPAGRGKPAAAPREGGGGAGPFDMRPLLSLAQEQRLDGLLAQFKELAEKNQIQDIMTSSVMELYEYKLAAMEHSERVLLSSLEAANEHATQMQHRVAQLAAEISRHHQLLYGSQQCVEGLRAEKAALQERLQQSQDVADKTQCKLIEEFKNRKAVVNELNNTIEDLRKAFALKENELQSAKMAIESLHSKENDMKLQYSSLESSHKDVMLKYADLIKLKGKLEERISKRERIIQDRDSEIAETRKQNDALKTEVANLNMINKMHEKSIHEKESEVQRLSTQLSDLERLRTVIFDLTSGQKKFE